MIKYFKIKSVVLIIFIFLYLNIYAQYVDNSHDGYNDFASNFFSGRQPSTRAEAIGKGYVAIGGDIYSTFYNPAGISTINGFMFNASYSTPYYLLEEATYSFIGIAYKFNRYIVVSLDRYHFNYGWEFEEIGIEGPTGIIIKPYMSNYKLTFGSKPFTDLHIGISTNLFLWDLGRTFRAFCFDVGVIKELSLFKDEYSEQKINLAGSIVNFSNSKLTGEMEEYNNGTVTMEVEDLPVIARIGFCYEFSYNKNLSSLGPKTFAFLIHTEYQDMLNYDYRTAIRFGMELSFFEILFMRAGAYRESIDASSKNELTDFTYGFGIQFPFGKLSNGYKELKIKLDFVYMPQVSYSKESYLFDELDNFLNIGLLINYKF